MSYLLATTQQLAAIIVEGGDAFPGPKFIIQGTRSAWRLEVVSGDHMYVLCSTRDVASARQFTTLEAAVQMAQRIAATAGREQDHGWTGEASRLPMMPIIEVAIDYKAATQCTTN